MAMASSEDIMIVVEGEIDVLSFMEAGITNVVSVPDGAPAKAGSEFRAKFDYLENDNEFMDKVSYWMLAGDNDSAGLILREELARRFGKERCLLIDWPKGCKDANEVLVKYGKKKLLDSIATAKPFPILGIIEPNHLIDSVTDAWQNGIKKGVGTGWDGLNKYYTIKAGELNIVTGMPGHGKSEWLDAMMVNLAQSHGYYFAVFSPENAPTEQHCIKLVEKYIGKPFQNTKSLDRMTSSEMKKAMKWLHDHFCFINPSDETVTIEKILELARAVILRKGANGIVIDPWNEIDHSRDKNVSETEYISSCLSKIRRFARLNNVSIWLVSHPAKLTKDKSGSYPCPTPYDISGSAHWRNKADNCLAIYRPDFNNPLVQLHIQKIRSKIVGKVGKIDFNYDWATGRYFEINKTNTIA